jgi:3-methyladenine DNA glycosylase AlkD
MPARLTADEFLKRLKVLRSSAVARSHGGLAFDQDDGSLGVRMGQVFALAKEFMAMPLEEIETMLESSIHEMRVGAVSIMDFQARSRKTPGTRRKELFDLYIRRHDRINTWDLVDRSAPYVIGGYLFDKPRKILYKLAQSPKMPERRTAIASTGYFIRQGEVDDTFKIAGMLINDKEDLIHRATGWMLRAAGGVDRQKLLNFLENNAASMARTMLRYATEHIDKGQREVYLNMNKTRSANGKK